MLRAIPLRQQQHLVTQRAMPSKIQLRLAANARVRPRVLFPLKIR
jgi:hypothetical protein